MSCHVYRQYDMQMLKKNMTSLVEVIKKNVYQRYSSSPEPDHAHLHTWPLINTCNSFTQLQNYCTDRFSPQNINISSQDSLTILSSDIGLTQISACSTLHNIMQKNMPGVIPKVSSNNGHHTVWAGEQLQLLACSTLCGTSQSSITAAQVMSQVRSLH